jgi:two-component system OmpR family response regulator
MSAAGTSMCENGDRERFAGVAIPDPREAATAAHRGADDDGLWRIAGSVLSSRRRGLCSPPVPAVSRRMSRTIAIVEDEPAIRANYVDAFKRYGWQVAAFASRPEAQIAFALKLPDLVVIDVGLGEEPEGGFDLCRELRARSATLPILFLTARDSDLDIISGLRLGADDYLTKDISLPQLTARVQALFRRMDALRAPSARDTVLTLRGLRLEVERMRVSWNGEEVPLTVTEFWMVHALARHPGHVKSREQLMREAQIVVDDATVTSHIKRMRKKFIAIDAAFDEIDTVHGAGYRWRP